MLIPNNDLYQLPRKHDPLDFFHFWHSRSCVNLKKIEGNNKKINEARKIWCGKLYSPSCSVPMETYFHVLLLEYQYFEQKFAQNHSCYNIFMGCSDWISLFDPWQWLNMRCFDSVYWLCRNVLANLILSNDHVLIMIMYFVCSK